MYTNAHIHTYTHTYTRTHTHTHARIHIHTVLIYAYIPMLLYLWLIVLRWIFLLLHIMCMMYEMSMFGKHSLAQPITYIYIRKYTYEYVFSLIYRYSIYTYIYRVYTTIKWNGTWCFTRIRMREEYLLPYHEFSGVVLNSLNSVFASSSLFQIFGEATQEEPLLDLAAR